VDWALPLILVSLRIRCMQSARAGPDGPAVPLRIRLVTAAGTRNLPKGDNMTRFVALFLIAATALLAGCNTVAGAGEDISKGGQAIHNSAEQAK
jgi:predicted small secreted protein